MLTVSEQVLFPQVAFTEIVAVFLSVVLVFSPIGHTFISLYPSKVSVFTLNSSCHRQLFQL
jgi:general stress protein CsbA